MLILAILCEYMGNSLLFTILVDVEFYLGFYFKGIWLLDHNADEFLMNLRESWMFSEIVVMFNVHGSVIGVSHLLRNVNTSWCYFSFLLDHSRHRPRTAIIILGLKLFLMSVHFEIRSDLLRFCDWFSEGEDPIFRVRKHRVGDM